MTTYTSHYPTQSSTYVKATTENASNTYHPYYATDPTKSLTGVATGNAWVSSDLTITNQRFHIDLESSYIIRRFYYENYQDSGNTNIGCKNFTFWGSNNAGAFAELTYATNTNWTQLTTNISQLLEHVNSDVVDPKYVLVTNSTAYRYYAVKIADTWGSTGVMGIRRIELQTEDGFEPVTFIPRIIYF